MSKSEKSGGSKKNQAGSGSEAAPQDGQGVVVYGTIDGKIRGVEVGLITGDVTQSNSSDQGASNVALNGSGSQETGQVALQTNTVVVEGDAALDITVNGTFKGQIRDVEVGLITGDVTQTNVAVQAAENLSVGDSGSGSQTIGQVTVQDNHLAATGDVEVSMVFDGAFKGKVRDLEVGLITADVTQTNTSTQGAANVSTGGGGGSQAIGQISDQVNYLAVVGNIDVTLVFEGDFKGQVRDISIGLVTGDVSQTNTAIQIGMNISAGRHKGPQSIDQFIIQTNSIDANGDIDVFIKFDPNYKGDYRDIEITLAIDNVLQSNLATQSALNAATDSVWG